MAGLALDYSSGQAWLDPAAMSYSALQNSSTVDQVQGYVDQGVSVFGKIYSILRGTDQSSIYLNMGGSRASVNQQTMMLVLIGAIVIAALYLMFRK